MGELHEVPEEYQEAFGAILETGEKLILVRSNRNMTKAYVLTDRRYVEVGGKKRKVWRSIPLSEITAVDMATVADMGPFGGTWESSARIGFRLLTEDRPNWLFIPNDPGRDFGRAIRQGSAEWTEWVEGIPRKISELTELEFAAPEMMSIDKGTGISFYLDRIDWETGPHWPQICVSCMTPLEEPVYDKLELWYKTKHLIPYCPRCHKNRFGPLKKRRAVKAIDPKGITHKVLWFEKRRYAEAFMEANFT